jgi:hypothetical protein
MHAATRALRAAGIGRRRQSSASTADVPITTSLEFNMSDEPEIGWSRRERQNLADQFALLGRIGFYAQLVLLVVPVALTIYLLMLGRSGQGAGTSVNLGNFLSFGSLLVMIFTTYWFFRYIRLGERLKDSASFPPRSNVISTLWIGLWAGCLGIVLSILLLFAAAWRILFVLLTNPQSGMLIAPTPGTNPTYSLSAIDALSLTLLIIGLAVELMVLGLTLWLVFQTTRSAPASTGATPEMFT